MDILSFKQAVAAREELALSQAGVARAVGISRPYLSDFERGKRVLEDRWLTALHEHYVELGWVPAAETQPSAGSKKTANGFRVADGFVIAGQVSNETAEALLEEHHQNSCEINELCTNEVVSGFFGGLDEEATRGLCLRPFLLLARQREILQVLQGQYEPSGLEINASSPTAVRTIGEYMEVLLSKAVPGRHDSTGDSEAETA